VWTAQLSYDAPGLDAARRQEITAALGATELRYDEERGWLTVTVEVDAATLRQAADAALRAASQAVGSAAAGVMSSRPRQIRVLPADDFAGEIAHPAPVELMGVSEIAELLGVSRQRVNQLIAGEDFPRPVSRLAAGPVFTTASIEAFQKRWTRKSGRPWHKAAANGSAAGRPATTTPIAVNARGEKS